MAQALTGHGYFQRYLFDKRLAEDPSCIQCGNQDDTVEHTLLDCPFWEQSRREVERAIGHRPKPEDVPLIIFGEKPEDLPRIKE